jgi:hypothetical protein
MDAGSSIFHELLNPRSCLGKIKEEQLTDATGVENSSLCFKTVEVYESLLPIARFPFARFSNIGIASHFHRRINLAIKPVNWQFPRCI